MPRPPPRPPPPSPPPTTATTHIENRLDALLIKSISFELVGYEWWLNWVCWVELSLKHKKCAMLHAMAWLDVCTWNTRNAQYNYDYTHCQSHYVTHRERPREVTSRFTDTLTHAHTTHSHPHTPHTHPAPALPLRNTRFWARFGWFELCWAASGCARRGCTGSGWAGLGSARPGCAGLASASSGWDCFGCASSG